ncbi:MAG: AccI family restriction endonuclease [Candidatus Micrarchaeia archaeon]
MTRLLKKKISRRILHPFERVLSVSEEDIELDLSASELPWSDFLLNPRRLRGSDFLMRWSQGVWSEDRIIQAVNEERSYYAIHYGPSGTAPDNDVRAYELYFERLEQAGLGNVKRPDILIFRAKDKGVVDDLIQKNGGLSELPFNDEKTPLMKELLSKAIVAIECENSLWVAKKMPDYGRAMTPQKRLGGKNGMKKVAVLPTVIVKEEDRKPLLEWQSRNNISIHIWHVFYDMGFGMGLNTLEELIRDGKIAPTEQVFQAPGGATTRKTIYKVYYHYAYPLGNSTEEPKLIPAHIVDKNGHILPYVRFEGGRLTISKEAIAVLDEFAGR